MLYETFCFFIFYMQAILTNTFYLWNIPLIINNRLRFNEKSYFMLEAGLWRLMCPFGSVHEIKFNFFLVRISKNKGNTRKMEQHGIVHTLIIELLICLIVADFRQLNSIHYIIIDRLHISLYRTTTIVPSYFRCLASKEILTC